MRALSSRTRSVVLLLVGTLALCLLAAGYSDAPVRADVDAVSAAQPAGAVPAAVAGPGASGPLAGTGGKGKKRPNIILITTDDQATSDMRWMPRTVRYLGGKGVTFSRALSPHPLCCPARGAILTGQYAQNNGVKSNHDPFAFQALKTRTTLPVWLDRAGYQTAFTGKYLNGFTTKGKPQPGWDYWDVTRINPYAYVNYEQYQDGDPQWYKDVNVVDYTSQRTRTLVEQFSRKDRPFFIWASHVAPHGRIDKIRDIPSTAVALPPARFKNRFSSVQSPSLRDPGYAHDRVTDKNSLVQSKNRPSRAKVNEVFRSRIRTLQGVDQGIEQLIRTLHRVGELDNTYIIFTSDNGFLLGEHQLITKNVPYRQSLRVPMIVRGPGVPRGEVRSQRALMIDLAPTIADIAGARPLVPVDGVSLLPTLQRGAPLRDTVLIQAGPQTDADLPYGWWWRGVTTDRYTYARFFQNDLEELYDHLVDPAETDNVADDPRYAPVIAELRRRTQQLVTCSGPAQCSADFGPVPEPHGD